MSAILDIILNAAAAPVIHTLLHFLWQGSLIGLVLLAVIAIARPRDARIRYRLYCWALCLMILMPALTATRYVHRERGHQARVREFQNTSTPAQPTTETIRLLARDIPTDTASSGLAGPLLRDVALRLEGPDIKRWIFLAWLSGVLVLSLTHFGGWLRVRKLRRLEISAIPDPWRERSDRLCRKIGIRKTVEVLCSAAVEVPTVIGWLRPVVLIPVSAFSGLPIEQLECILAHELAHIRRRDYLVNLLQICAETLLFYHPAVWWISRQIRIERENCCDDIAVSTAGDRLLYARTLVDLEEMRLASPRLAMGADGGSLTWRVKRLIGGTDMSLQYKTSQLAGTLAALIMLIGVSAISLSAQPEFGDMVALAAGDQVASETLRGRWFADRVDDQLEMEFSKRSGDRHRRNRWNTTESIDIKDFDDLEFTENSEFSLKRDAGVFNFRGDFEGSGKGIEGSGSFTFTADKAYLERLSDLGTPDLEDVAIMVLATRDLKIKAVSKLRDMGYGPFDSDELVTIAIFEVTPDYIKEIEALGFKDADIDQLVSMRVHDIDETYIKSMRSAGVHAESLDDLISWSVHDVDSDYVAEMQKSFGKDMDLDNILSLKIHGVTPEYAEEMRREFGDDLDNDDLLSFKIHDITPNYAETIKALGYDLDAEDLLSWKIHDVSAEFIRELAELGYRNIDADDLMSLKIHGASPKWIRHLREKGIDDLDVEDLIKLRISGVDL